MSYFQIWLLEIIISEQDCYTCKLKFEHYIPSYSMCQLCRLICWSFPTHFYLHLNLLNWKIYNLRYFLYVGDLRSNENVGLTALQTLFVREHNRIADLLKAYHPFWDNSVIFEEARRINIAQYQHIVYNELLPVLIGKIKNNVLMWC